MPDIIPSPHDSFFKEMFTKKEVARDHLLNFLPVEVLSNLDLDTLEITKDSFVDPELKEHFSDLLYKVSTKDASEVYVYILFEHKSHPDSMVAFQLLRYIVNIWNTQQKQTKNKKLPFIIPLVFYHGVEKWNISTKLIDIVDMPIPCVKYVPDFQYELNNLSQFSDEQIKGQILNRAVYTLCKHIFSDDIGKWFEYTCTLLSQLESNQTALEFLETALKYVSTTSEKIDEETIQKSLQKALPVQGEKVMPTLAEKWFAQGKEEGREEGREEGKEEGIETGIVVGLQDGIQLALKLKFGAEGLPLCERVKTIDSLEELKQIKEILLQSDSINEIKPYFR